MPADRPGLIHRPRLVDLLLGASDDPLIVLSAPVGYGKSTLLAQWARRDDRTFAWVSLGPQDGRVVPLFILIATAVGRALGVPPAVFNAETPGISVIGQVVPRLVAALTKHAEPLVLVIHNIHEVHDKDAKDALDLLVANLPAHVQLAVSSRQPVWLTTPARRARREVLELGLVGSRPRTRRVGTPAGDHSGGPGTGRSGRHHVLDGGMARRCVPVVAGSASARNGVRPSVAPGRSRDHCGDDQRLRARRSPCRDATRHHPLPAQGVDPRGDVGTVVRRSPAHRGLRPAPRLHLQVEPARRPDRRRRLLVPVPHAAANGVARRSPQR